MLLGGETYNERTLPRFFVLHAAVLPAAMTLTIAIHIAIVRLQGVTEFRFEGESEEKPRHFQFFPDHVMTELIIGLALMVLLSALAVLSPAILGPKADPLTTPEVKPEWFFYVAFRWLKLFSGTAAILSMSFILFIMFAWPFIDGWIRKRRPTSEISVWVGVAAVAAIIGLTVWEAVAPH